VREGNNGKRLAMPFAIPVLWREPKNHVDDCQICCVIVIGFSAKNKHKIVYKNEANPRDDNLPVPVPPQNGLAFITRDDNLPVPEPPENGLTFLEQTQCADG
jgi:hypothetical protein